MGQPDVVQRLPARRLTLFVVAAFGISWTLWFLHPVFSQDQGVALTLDQLATFGPAAAALLVADDRPATPGHRPRALAPIAGIATLAVTALLLTPRWIDASSALEEALLVVLAVVPAALVWAAGSRTPRFANLLGSILSPRSAWWTYAVALLLFPAASMLGSGLVMMTGGNLGAQPQVLSEGTWAGILIVFALTLLFGGPLGEEIGWRGWLLPTLQARLSPLLASLIIGLVWGLWHLPLHLRGMYDGDMGTGAAGFAVRIAGSCLLAVLFTWLYNRARGGLLVVILLHTSVNNTSGYWLPVNIGLTMVLLVVCAVVVVTDRMYARPSTISHERSIRMQES
jgi:membrane protease YdiL (CAAX protease family)